MNEYLLSDILSAGYSKNLNRALRREFNKSHFIPELRLLKQYMTANSELRLKSDRSARLETRLKSAVLHRLSNSVSRLVKAFKSQNRSRPNQLVREPGL